VTTVRGWFRAALAGATIHAIQATAVGAQVPAMPVLYWPSNTSGPSIHATYSLASGELGRQRAAGLMLGYAGGRFHLTGTLARVGSRDDRHFGTTAGGVNASIRLLHRFSPAISVNLQGGVGGGSFDEAGGSRSQLNLPVGIGFAFLAPMPIGNIEVWGAPRVQLRRTRFAATSTTDTGIGGGISLGIEWTSVHGVGAHLGLDWLRIQSAAGAGGVTERSLGVGLHFRTTL
jgi:hypothetical protein